MTAFYRVKRKASDAKWRTLIVEDVASEAHAQEIGAAVLTRHAEVCALISVEEFVARYTAHEVRNERGLLGDIRRYSTGEQTVTIPGR